MTKQTARYDNILSLVELKSEADQLDDTIDTLLEKLFSVKKNSFSETLSKSLKKEVVQEIESTLKKEKINWSDHETVRKFFTDLQECLHSLKVIKLTLVLAPSQKTLEKISLWVKESFGKNAIWDIEINKEIIGGAILVVSGIYKDLSLKTRIQNVFANKKEEILKKLS